MKRPKAKAKRKTGGKVKARKRAVAPGTVEQGWEEIMRKVSQEPGIPEMLRLLERQAQLLDRDGFPVEVSSEQVQGTARADTLYLLA